MQVNDESEKALSIAPFINLHQNQIDLLRAVGETRSIAAAARTLGMPYERAWLLADSLNVGFGRALVATATGGGGAALTTLGDQIVIAYDALEIRLNTEAAPKLAARYRQSDSAIR